MLDKVDAEDIKKLEGLGAQGYLFDEQGNTSLLADMVKASDGIYPSVQVWCTRNSQEQVNCFSQQDWLGIV